MTLLLVMQIPLLMVSGLIGERQDRYDEVLRGFRRSWGPAQNLAGPILAVPYVKPSPDEKAVTPGQRQRGWVRIPANQLSIAATLEPETRQRGFFRAVVYTASVEMTGTIIIPELRLSEMPSARLLWNEAVLVTAASDLRGQPADGTVEWDGQRLKQNIQSINGTYGRDRACPPRRSPSRRSRAGRSRFASVSCCAARSRSMCCRMRVRSIFRFRRRGAVPGSPEARCRRAMTSITLVSMRNGRSPVTPPRPVGVSPSSQRHFASPTEVPTSCFWASICWSRCRLT